MFNDGVVMPWRTHMGRGHMGSKWNWDYMGGEPSVAPLCQPLPPSVLIPQSANSEKPSWILQPIFNILEEAHRLGKLTLGIKGSHKNYWFK